MLSQIPLKPHLSKIWLALTGRSPRLLELAAVQNPGRIVGSYYAGRQTIPLSQIRGSASSARCTDFDANFQPLKTHLQTRCQSITAARRRGVKLPPVTLIQVGELYFVEDGHHRISVARRQGEHEIEAEVTVWQMAGPWPEDSRSLSVLGQTLTGFQGSLQPGAVPGPERPFGQAGAPKPVRVEQSPPK